MEKRKPEPSGMIGIELQSLFDYGTAVLPVTGGGHQSAHVGYGASIHRIECDGSLRSGSEGLEFLPVEMGGCQSLKTPVIGTI